MQNSVGILWQESKYPSDSLMMQTAIFGKLAPRDSLKSFKVCSGHLCTNPRPESYVCIKAFIALEPLASKKCVGWL